MILFFFGVLFGILLGIMLSTPHKHVDDFVRDTDAYNDINILLGKTVEKGKMSALAMDEGDDACPITNWNYFWSNLLGRIQWWNTIRKQKPETTIEKIKRELEEGIDGLLD